jgi:transglutaminase-like putative cysteine protease
MRLRIVHRAGYRYDAPVATACVEARLFVASTPGQRIQSTTLESDPSSWRHSYRDYWGTATDALHLSEPHTTFALVATTVVDVGPAPSDGHFLTWEELDSDAFAEYLAGSPASRQADTPSDVAHGLVSRPGMESDRLVGELRRAGIPARIVRGCLVETDRLAIGDSVDAAPHSWVEYWDSSWRGLDPSVGGPAGEGHLAMAYGRDHSDCCPLRGVYSGEGGSQPYSFITVKRLG